MKVALHPRMGFRKSLVRVQSRRHGKGTFVRNDERPVFRGLATGTEHRRLGVEGCEPLEGRGVYYAATPMEAQLCHGSDVVVVGGGNSAGQAAVYLTGHARKVCLVIRGDDLYKNMSSYLAHRIEQTPKIELLLNTEVG